MYNTTADYKTYIKKPSREFECRITLGTRIFNNSNIIQIVPNIIQPKNGFSIGNTISQSIDITLKNDGGVYASVGIVNVEIGLKIGNSIEYIPTGLFHIDDVIKTDYTVKITAYDNMIKFETPYFSSLGDTPTLQQVVDELEDITGVGFIGTVPNYTVSKLQGYTCREVLAYVASVCGGNAYITRDGKFTIVYPNEVDCTVTAANYVGSGYKIEDQVYKIGMVTCQNKNNNDSSSDENYDSVNDKNTISVGSLSSDTMELTFENPWVTPTILTDIYNKLKNFSYLGYTMKWQGDLSLDPGDIVTVIDKKNVTRKAYVFANKLTYTGGLVAETSAKGETKNSNSFSSSGPGTKDIQRLSVQLLIAEKAIITKANIKDLQATNAKIENLDVAVATINTALINYAKVDQLDAVKANIVNLLAADATINSALINKAEIAQLNATNANISNLNATVGTIQTLINGNLTSANIQSLVLTSSKVTVDNGFIKNAMIESLDVTKINAGTLNTNKISVSSSDGGLIIAGATQQFKDKNNNVRLQLGQDATGDFNFILRAADGTTTLIDGYGIKANAIADKLIKTNMVADSAIGEQQINYSSFVTGMNAATNTNYIKASKVAIDLTGQSLDIAFSNINTTISSVQTTANSAKSAIDGLQVGGRNLLLGTSVNTNKTTTGFMTWALSNYMTTGIYTIKFKYTITVADPIGISLGSSTSYDGSYEKLATLPIGAGVYYTATINFTRDTQTHLCIYTNQTITISELKLEKGNTSTSWTPAPEDIDSSIASVKTVTDTNTTSISAIQGQITTLISNTTITTGGTTTQLKDAYNSTVATVNSMLTTIGEHTSKIDTANANITSVTSKEAALEVTVNSINASLTDTKSTVTTHTTQISTANTNITTALNNASAAVTTANTATTTANTAKTTATTASTDATSAKTTANTASANASTALTNANSAVTTSNTASTNASNALTTANKASTDVATLTTTVSTVTSRVTAVELTASGLTTRVGATETAISSLKIGGRNLLKNTANFVNLNYWGLSKGPGQTGILELAADNVYGNAIHATKTNNVSWWVLSNYPTMLPNNKFVVGQQYTISFIAKSSVAGSIIAVNFVDGNGTNFITVNQTVTLSTAWTKYSSTFTATATGNTPELYITTAINEIWLTKIKLEEGNMATDWTPALEDIDSSIAAVKDYATTTINSNVSTINQTTNAISASVTALQSRATTIETTLGNKADTTTVTAISNRTATLETSVTGINASITTLNSNVSSVTTTANAAKTAIDGLQVGGRNLLTDSGFELGTINKSGVNSGVISIVTEDKYYGTKSMKVVTSAANTSSGGCVICSNLVVGTKYTASIWIKCTTSGSVSFRIMNSTWGTVANSVPTLVANTWTKLILTFTATEASCKVGVLNGAAKAIIFYIDNIKVEEGTMATTWTPAPEDIDASISSVQTYATTNITSLTSSVSVLQSQIALKVEQTQINTAVATLDGKITATNSTVSSLQAQINVQAGLISSKVNQTDVSNVNLIIKSNLDKGNLSGDYGVELSDSTYDRFVRTGFIIIDSISYALTISGDTNKSIIEKIIVYDTNKNYIKTTIVNSKSTIQSFTQGYIRIVFVASNGDTTFNKDKLYADKVKLEKGTQATAWSDTSNSIALTVGTIITQSPTEVMTAFNGISNYFQVSTDGAKFGNLASGAYTKMSDKGLVHHVGTIGYDYKYVTYVAKVLIDTPAAVSGGTSVTVTFPDEIITMLGGKIPKGLASISECLFNYGDAYYFGSIGIFVSNVTATNITLTAYNWTGGEVSGYFLIIG